MYTIGAKVHFDKLCGAPFDVTGLLAFTTEAEAQQYLDESRGAGGYRVYEVQGAEYADTISFIPIPGEEYRKFVDVKATLVQTPARRRG
jgi:hypothetical protein